MSGPRERSAPRPPRPRHVARIAFAVTSSPSALDAEEMNR